MISKEITIKNESGLESKVAARLIQKVSGFESNIWIQKMIEGQMQRVCWEYCPSVSAEGKRYC